VRLCLKVVSCEKIADSDFSCPTLRASIFSNLSEIVPSSLQLFLGYNADKTKKSI
jgi:hypothetical protein